VPDTAVVHIIEDDASLREAIDSLLRSVGLTTRSYGSVQSFLSAARPDLPGCLLLDVRLPGMSGLDFQTSLADHDVHLPAIMMTGHGDIPMTVRAMKAGAIDFLTKPFRDQDMLDAVTAAIEKDRRRREGDQGAAALRAKYESLTPREQQVMALVTAGKMNKQVAADLNLSEITVKIHRGSAMRKMAARSLADLVRMAEALGPPVPTQAAPKQPAQKQAAH
jgi:FixJ family two-component response regulator